MVNHVIRKHLKMSTHLQRTRASVHLETLATVADPSLAKVTDRTDHGQAGGEQARMADQAIARLQHALDLAALCADGQSLDALTEVAKGPRLLLPVGRNYDTKCKQPEETQSDLPEPTFRISHTP